MTDVERLLREFLPGQRVRAAVDIFFFGWRTNVIEIPEGERGTVHHQVTVGVYQVHWDNGKITQTSANSIDPVKTMKQKERAVLEALQEGKGNGIDIIERCKKNGVKITMFSIYPILRALEERGLVQSSEDGQAHPERAGRPRYYYELVRPR